VGGSVGMFEFAHIGVVFFVLLGWMTGVGAS
jgi:hypothetical protein